MTDSTSSERIKVAVVGTGHLGKQHVRLYHELEEVELVGIVDCDEPRVKELAAQYGVPAYLDHTELPSSVQAVSVVVPTSDHFVVSSYFLERGIHVLVEKPMTRTVEEAEALVALKNRTGALLQVGHVERFNPAILAIDQLALRPLFIEAHRISPFRFRSADIGVVMDLMIHDLDVILHLVDSEVKSIDALGVNVIGDMEDIASARVVFENHCVANVTASRVSTKTQRTIRIFSPDSYVSLDYGARQATIFRKPEVFKQGGGLAGLAASVGGDLSKLQDLDFGSLLQPEKVVMDDEEPLKSELASFVHSIRAGATPMVTGEQGLRALKASVEVVRQIGDYLAAVGSR